MSKMLERLVEEFIQSDNLSLDGKNDYEIARSFLERKKVRAKNTQIWTLIDTIRMMECQRLLSDTVEIKNFVESRGITSLIHFTAVDNIPGILVHGLLGRETMASKGLELVFNDTHRLDNVADAVSASISFPNYKMFYSLQMKDPNKDWAVLRLAPSILWEIPCAFCVTNAASREVTKIPIEERTGIKAFAAMFGDIPPNIKRNNLEIPDEFCTDPQAEVLILGAISPSYILDINMNGMDKINDMETKLKLFKPYPNDFNLRHDESLFTYREDYKHWQKQLSPNETTIVLLDI